jgi:predicted GTPase
MSKAFEELAREATQLSREQRNDLASLLLELNEGSADAEVSAEWEREILARIKAVDDGEVEGVSFDDVMRDAESRLTP